MLALCFGEKCVYEKFLDTSYYHSMYSVMSQGISFILAHSIRTDNSELFVKVIFAINLFVGLSYSRLRKIMYGYYGILFLINLIVLFLITAYSRYGTWIRKDALFATFGVLGVIGMDWLALLAVLIFDTVIGVLIVEIMMWRIKKVPISLGVIQ